MKKSLSLKNLKELDKSDMLGILYDFPGQCRQAYLIAQNAAITFKKNGFTKIVFAGVGGSAIGADLVKSYLYFESSLPITVVREYDLPAFVDKTTLVFISSYSGNTQETLSAYSQAKKREATVIAISSDGKLKEYAQSDGITFVEIPGGLPSRCAIAYLSIIPICILARLGLAKDAGASIDEMAEVLEDLKENNLNPRIGEKGNIAKHIAGELFNKLAVIYAASVHFEAVVTRFRGQLNENSKALASSHLFPEIAHNEIMGWQNPKNSLKNLALVVFRDKGVHQRVTRTMDIVLAMLKKQDAAVLEVWSRGEGLLSRVFSLIYIGDFASYYLAILYGIDPTPTKGIVYLKEQLRKLKEKS